ncbi:MAG TPA: MATE family efflux transporter [Candidatus Scatomonas pullistercoris]|uniref:Multidrug export protein MepA n=1 Tax=Candidatus Scatomonas pullistercoris TaxID=2840920 RepID=A0A9D1P1B9_9FIRM|nr:MATE family efflux transporter [Candidatus Scatomonas pullistercoris]
MPKRKEINLGEGNVGKLMFRLALPAITAQIINLLYNLVDRMYIGHLKGIGAAALTGVGVTLPVILAISAFAYLFSAGGAARASIMMGKKKNDEAERILGNCTAVLILAALVLTVFFQFFGRSILMIFGASENTIGYAWDYMQIYSLGTIFVQIALGLNNFINAQGYAAMGMLSVIIGAGTNIILDPILMYVFDMGVRGAALATIISQALSAVWILAFLSSRRSFLKLKLKNLRISGKILGPCIALGAAPFVMQFTESILNICFNVSLKAYGGDIAVGVMAVLSSVMQFALLPIMGMTQGSQPIISYNYGAGKLERVRRAFRVLLKCSVIYAIILWALAMLFPQMFMRMFTTDAEYIAMGTWSMRVYTAAICVMGVQYACQQTFVALGNARTSLWLALLRKVFLLIPLIFILPRIFKENQVFAVFLAEPVADVVAASTTAVLFWRFLKKIMNSGGEIQGDVHGQ